MTRVWADEFGRSGVRVNAVRRGHRNAGHRRDAGPDQRVGELTTLGRVADPDEMPAP